MSYGKAVRDELRVPTRELRHAIPLVYAGYKELHDAALAAGARRPASGSRPGTSTRSASPMATSTPVERRRRMTLGSLRAGIRHQAKQVVMVNRSSAS